MEFTASFLIPTLLFIWVLILSIVVFRLYLAATKISGDGKKDSVMALLNQVLAHELKNEKTLDHLIASYDKINKDGQSHIQKIGLVRFNPFKDTGGDQSFILAILNGREDGILISSLHGRAGTRWFAKSVRAGKGVEHELSNEEKEALTKAKVT